ncbi:MAG: alpha/beta hydrolase [Rhizobiaceae bacterium]|nr:alpha/beta hydrolase [Rhizobiaceae bacterium]
MSKPSKFEISVSKSPTGAQLCIYQMDAGNRAKGVVHINHGMAEHAGRYARFAVELTNAGYHVIAHDHRGHGKTKAEDAPLGMFSPKDGLQKTVEDILHVNKLARAKYPGLPVILFCHSMGTILGFNYLLAHPQTVAAAALWNTGFDTGFLAALFKALLGIERMFKGSDVPSTIAHKLTFEDWNKKFTPNRTPCDWLSRDKNEVDKYVADPLCGFMVSNSLWRDVLQGVYFGANDANLSSLPKNLPMNLTAGGADPCSNKGKAAESLAARLTKTGLENVTLNILPHTRHESLNEINRDETIANFIRWLDENVRP